MTDTLYKQLRLTKLSMLATDNGVWPEMLGACSWMHKSCDPSRRQKHLFTSHWSVRASCNSAEGQQLQNALFFTTELRNRNEMTTLAAIAKNASITTNHHLDPVLYLTCSHALLLIPHCIICAPSYQMCSSWGIAQHTEVIMTKLKRKKGGPWTVSKDQKAAVL